MIKRLTDKRHIPQILELGRKYHRLSAMKNLPFDAQRSAEVFKIAFGHPMQAVWGAFTKNKLHGVLLGQICEFPWFKARYVTDLVFIADKEGEKLFYAMRNWAEARGVEAIQMGVTSGMEGAGEFYESRGLKLVGGIYYKELKSLSTPAMPDVEVGEWT